MNKKVFYHNSFSYCVTFEDKSIQQILRLCEEKKPLETGGILIGSYSEDGTTANVRNISGPPQDSKHGRRYFYRGVSNLASWLSELWTSTGEFYLGEWHYHPDSWPTPSPTDIKQMKRIATDPKYHCPEPILFIVGGDTNRQWYSSCHIFIHGKTMIKLTEDL